jgi:SNF2 family DNA or RNA helicase
VSSAQRSYQAEGSAFLRQVERGVLADEPGLGKTNQAILAAEGRTLVVVPAVLLVNWQRELAEWRAPGQEFTLTTYSRLCKRGERNTVSPVLRPEWQGRWDTVIFDECHALRNRQANWTKAALKLKSERTYLLSGTPLAGWAWDVWPLLRLVNPGDDFARSFWRWADHWFKSWEPPYRKGRELTGLRDGFTWEDFAQGTGLADRWLRRTMDEVLTELPPLTREVLEVELQGEQAKAYRSLKKDLVAEVERGLLVSWHSGDQFVKLAQLATGLGVAVPDYGVRQSAKLEALGSLLQERTRPSLVFAHFRQSAQLAAETARGQGKTAGVLHGGVPLEERQRLVDSFQAGELDVLAGTFGVMAEGLTLTAADLVVFLERSPRLLYNFQAERRVQRFGQERPCLRVDLVARGTVDERLLERLAAKGEVEAGIVEALELL